VTHYLGVEIGIAPGETLGRTRKSCLVQHPGKPFDDFARAITAARDLATPGDVVLLSPGCAS